MKKRAVYLLCLMAIFTTIGCQKRAIIPDDTLAEIFHDAFIVNAYIGEERINLDSLQVYEPLLERYGYTTKDIVYTVGNFSRRKSARLGTVVEQAIARLEQESKVYAKKVVILDTIRNVAVRSLSRTLYTDSLIRIRKRADSTALFVEIAPIPQGEYIITYNYKCEEDLNKEPRRAAFYFEDKDGFRSGYTSFSVRKDGDIKRVLVSNKEHKVLKLDLGNFSNAKRYRPKKQNLEIRNLRVEYKPNEAAAIDSLFAKYVNIKIFADGFLIKKDSLTLSPDTTRVSTTPAPNN